MIDIEKIIEAAKENDTTIPIWLSQKCPECNTHKKVNAYYREFTDNYGQVWFLCARCAATISVKTNPFIKLSVKEEFVIKCLC